MHAQQIWGGFSSGEKKPNAVSVPEVCVPKPPWSRMDIGKCLGTCAHTHELTVFCSLSQVSALSSPGKMENLIFMELKYQLHEVSSVKWAASTFGPLQKSRLGEHELDMLRKLLENLVSLLLLPFHASLLRLSTLEPVSTRH